MMPYLPCLFDKILNIGYTRNFLKHGFVVTLHKNGNIHDVDSYRGKTLLSTLGKVFTRLLNNRLTDWAEKYGVYGEAQAGFRSDMGTTDLFVFYGLVSHMINSNKKL